MKRYRIEHVEGKWDVIDPNGERYWSFVNETNALYEVIELNNHLSDLMLKEYKEQTEFWKERSTHFEDLSKSHKKSFDKICEAIERELE